MNGGNFEELLVVELEVMRQHLQGLERRLLEEYRRALGGFVASSLVGGISSATQAWGCQLVDQRHDDLDSMSIGVPKVDDHMACTSLDDQMDCIAEDMDTHQTDDAYGHEVSRVLSSGGDSPKVAVHPHHGSHPHSRTPAPARHTAAWPPDHEPPAMRHTLRAGHRGSHGTPAIRSPARSPRASRNGTPAMSPRNSYRSTSPLAVNIDADTKFKNAGGLYQSESSADDIVQRVDSWKRRSELHPGDLPGCAVSKSPRSSGATAGRIAAMQRARAALEPKEQTSNDFSVEAMEEVSAEDVQRQLSNTQGSDGSVEDVQRQLSNTQGSDGSGLVTRDSSSPGICPVSRSPSPSARSASPGGFPHLVQSRRSSGCESAGSAQTAITAITNITIVKQDKHDFQVLEAWMDASNRQTLFGMSTHAASRTQRAGLSGLTGRRTSQRQSICQLDAGSIWEGFEERPLWYQAWSSIMVPPSSYHHLGWDLAAGILIIFDILLVPLQLIDPPSVLALTVAYFIVRLFWTTDFFASFLTGYIDRQGETVMKPGAVTRRYATTWMLPDLFLVICDWGEVVAKGTVSYGGAGYPRIAGIFSGLRLLRVVRLVRLTKAREVTEFIIEHVQSENIILIADILKIVAVMLALTHVIACAWYGLGKHGESWQRSWVKYRHLEEEVLLERYIWSFHCAIAFWSGEHIVLPRNTTERAFLATMMIVTFMLSVWFVSNMTTTMTRLQIIAGQNAVQFSALSRYLSAKKISQELRAKVLRNAQYALEQRKRNADESCIELLHVVSDPLRTELHFEVFSPVLFVHPFFRSFGNVNSAGIRKVCHVTLSKLDFSRGDIVFTEEVPAAPKMLFVVKGILLYVQERTRQRKVNNRNWLAEMVLWTTWSHRGTLHAASDCQLLALDAHKFIGVISKFPGNNVVSYAERFVKYLRQMESYELSDIGSEDEEIIRLANKAFQQEEVGRESVTSVSTTRGRNWLKRSQSEGARGVKFSFKQVLPNKKGNLKSAMASDGDGHHDSRQTAVKFRVGEDSDDES